MHHPAGDSPQGFPSATASALAAGSKDRGQPGGRFLWAAAGAGLKGRGHWAATTLAFKNLCRYCESSCMQRFALDISTPSLQQHPCRICCNRRVARNCRHCCALAACLLRVRAGPGRAGPDRCWANGPVGSNLRGGGTVLGLPGRSVVRIQALRKPICANSPVSASGSLQPAGKPVCGRKAGLHPGWPPIGGPGWRVCWPSRGNSRRWVSLPSHRE